jgi:hypothetical protein
MDGHETSHNLPEVATDGPRVTTQEMETCRFLPSAKLRFLSSQPRKTWNYNGLCVLQAPKDTLLQACKIEWVGFFKKRINPTRPSPRRPIVLGSGTTATRALSKSQ